MGHNPNGTCNTRPSDKSVDVRSNALFSALVASLGSSFQTGNSDRNLRSIVRSWCPFEKGYDPEMQAADFRKSYIPAHFFDRYFYAEELKQDHLKTSALEKFEANVIRGHYFNEVLSAPSTCSWLDNVLAEASLIAQRVIGEWNPLEVFQECRHGPNSTTTVRRRDAYPDVKSFDLTGTDGCVDIFVDYLRWNTSYRDWLNDAYRDLPAGWQEVTRVTGNNLSFVPKKFDSLRSMAAEPTLNMFFQLGTGAVITRRLHDHANLDLATLPESHKLMAGLASRFSEIGLATIDWSQASDRIWVNLIRRLLPSDWFDWLMLIRSATSTVVDSALASSVFDLPMIGTMGNGFTFPLQTLVFWCLLRAVARVEGIDDISISVFGDDCIVPCELMEPVERLAAGLGWSLNVDKSFAQGAFRESCGADCFKGLDTRPFFLERPTDKRANSLKAWAYTAVNGVCRVVNPVDRLPPDSVVVWLVETFLEFGLGGIHVVPEDYPDGSGLRVYDPAAFNKRYGAYPLTFRLPCETTSYQKMERKWCYYHQGRIISPGPDLGWKFSALLNAPDHQDVVAEYPFYDRWLRQQRVHDAPDWRTRCAYDVNASVPFTGVVPLKEAKYRTKLTFRQTWRWWATSSL